MKEIKSTDLAKVLGFNPSAEQMVAIISPLEPSMIVAGAGTGKTTVMAGRIAWLIMTQQVAPDRILGLTFTTKAANELATRVRSFLSAAIKYLPDEFKEVQAFPSVITYSNGKKIDEFNDQRTKTNLSNFILSSLGEPSKTYKTSLSSSTKKKRVVKKYPKSV